ncbi:ATP-binding cassette domain-containing protein [Hydrogenophaga sp. RWCD_12]|uniref:ATP-binding cassette domain-containing protein n=1 Tax=Hydrogenophaga sp. RWCD_12 TaxID=3391190 RepID=UPI0039855B72
MLTYHSHANTPHQGNVMAIVVEGLHYSWGRHALFDNLSTHTGPQGVFGLFGRNGSGKSSLLKILAGLLAPDRGLVKVNGFEPRQRSAEFLAGIYLLPEEFHLPDLSTGALGRTQAPFYPNFDDALFEQALAAFEVPDNLRFSRMSLGQKKKAAIALALATMTPVLLMDEPTNGLDIVSRATFKQLLSHDRQRQRLVVISTHQAHDLESLMNHIWFIDNGRIVLSASTQVLSQALEMGTASQGSEIPQDRLLYREPIGHHTAWLARRATGKPPPAEATPVQLELLYKALSHSQSAVIDAVHAHTPEVLA